MASKINLVKLLESVDVNALRSPDVLEKLQVMLESAVETAKTDAAAEATKKTAEELTAQFKKEAALATESFNAILEKQKAKLADLDAEYAKKLTEALAAVEKRCGEEAEKKVAELDEQACTELEKIVEAYEAKLKKFDEDAAEGLQKVVDKMKIDADAAAAAAGQKVAADLDEAAATDLEAVVKKMKEAHQLELETIDMEHTSFLEKVVEMYEKKLTEAKAAAVAAVPAPEAEKKEEPKAPEASTEAGETETQKLLARRVVDEAVGFDAAEAIQAHCDWSKVPTAQFEKTYSEAKQAYIKREMGKTPHERMIEQTLSVLSRSAYLR